METKGVIQYGVVVRRAILIFLPLAVVAGVVLAVLYRVQTNSNLTVLRAAERQALELAAQSVETQLGSVRSDLLYLSEHPTLRGWLSSDNAVDRRRLTQDMLAFVARKPEYDQVRVLDASGREMLRINSNSGHSAPAAERDLQNKSNRYYVRESSALGRGEIYVSPFDLNVEHGAIEHPLKPMIRFGTPVYDNAGRKRAIVVLNYLGQRLLDRIKTISAQAIGSVWLLNAKGYWIYGGGPEKDWGFMYPDRTERRFDIAFRDAWTSIGKGAVQDQFISGDDLFTFVRIMPQAMFGSRGAKAASDWILTSYIPSHVLAGNVAGSARSLWITFATLSFLFAAISWVTAFQTLRRRQAEASVRVSEARFRGLLESAADAIIISNREGRIVLANEQATKSFGYTATELIGRPIETLIPESIRDRHKEHRRSYVSAPYMRPMGSGLSLQGRRKDGSLFPVEINLSSLRTDEGLLVTSIVRDITERLKAEAARSEAQERYRDLVRNVPLGVHRKTPGPEGRFLEANPATVAMFEADSAEALLACPVSKLHRDPHQRLSLSDKIMRQGFCRNEELELVTLKGRVFWGQLSSVKKEDGQGNVFFDGVIEDITERKETERRIEELNAALARRAVELQATNKELESFSYSVSHDLRAPLRAIDGFSQVLIEDYAGKLDAEGRGYLDRVRAGVQRMGLLIDDVLQLSRLTRAELQMEEVDLSQLVEAVADELRARESQRDVEVSITPGLRAHGDPRLLRVALENLVNNAWKFTGKRDRARIEFGRAQQNGAAAFYVRDNGAGFDMTYVGKLFGAFQRLHDAREFPGTGVGLATVQRVVHKHGGRIWAEGAVEQGATFYFTLSRP